MIDLFRRRNFRLLLIGQTISSLGDWMGTLALMYFVLEISGSTTAVGGVLVLRLLPSAIGAPFAARVVSRFDRRQVMLASDLIRCGMAIALPILPWLAWVYCWAFAIEVVGLAFLPARDAAIPLLLASEGEGEEKRTGTLALANGITMGTSYGMIPIGAGAFGLILTVSTHLGWEGHWRYVVVFWLDALTYVLSYLFVRSIPGFAMRAHEDQRAGRAPGAEPESQGFLRALRLPVIRGILPAVILVAAGLGCLFSLGVVFVRNVLHAGPVGFGLLVALFGVGAAVGLVLLRRRGDRHLIAQVRLGTMVQGAVIATMGALASPFWSYLGAVAFGAAATTALVGAVTYVQGGLEGVERNLGLTAFHASLRFGLALAALASGAAADHIGDVDLGFLGRFAPSQTVLFFSGLVVICGGLLVRGAPGSGDGDAGGRAAARERAEHA